MNHQKKIQALKQSGTFNARYKNIKDPAFQSHDFFDPMDLIQVKYEMLRRVTQEHHSITEASNAFGFSRPVFYKTKDIVEKKGLAGLVPQKTGPHKASKLTDDVMATLVELKRQGQTILQLKDSLKTLFGLNVHKRSIERALKKGARHDKKK